VRPADADDGADVEPGRSLTIRAAPGVLPVIRPNPLTAGSRPGRGTLLHFRGGRIRLEGLEFRLEPGDRQDPLSAVLAEDTDLSIRGCLFRANASSQGARSLEAIHVRPGPADTQGGRPAPILVHETHFDG